MDAIAPRYHTAAPVEPVTWLSGGIVTIINKLGAVIWVAAVVGAISGILLSTGHFLIAPAFRFVAAFVFLATVFVVWLSMRIQRVGFAGRELVVSNYLRQERIPFDQVDAVEPVWWYYRRMVRVRLRGSSSLREVVYYIPKWAAIKCLWVAPEKELQELLKNR